MVRVIDQSDLALHDLTLHDLVLLRVQNAVANLNHAARDLMAKEVREAREVNVPVAMANLSPVEIVVK